MTPLRSLRDWLAAAPRRQEWTALALIMAVLLGLKLLFSRQVSDFGIDGGYYLDIARNVRDGLGFVTDVSLCHQGYPHFPYPTSVYPAWPLLLGYGARLLPLEALAVYLPVVLYAASLVLGFLWARGLVPSLGLPRAFASLNGGHLFAVLLGVNHSFFEYTSLPYTEGLAFFFALLLLWRATTRLVAPSPGGGFEIGLYAGLALLTRSQLVLLVFALVFTLAWASILASPRRYLPMTAATLAAMAALVTPMYLRLAAYLPGFGPSQYVYLEEARVSDLLSVVPVYVQKHGLDYVLDRLSGLRVAFSLQSGMGYPRSFSILIYALPLAVPLLAWALARSLGPERRARTVAFLRSPRFLPWLLVGVFALASVAAVHSLHKVYLTEWAFGRRHAIPVVFALFLALAFLLLRSGKIARWLTLALVVAGTLASLQLINKSIRNTREVSALELARRELVGFLVAERERRQELTVAAGDNEAQRLAWRTPGIGYHWVHDATTRRDVDALVDVLGVDLLVVRADARPAQGNDPRGAPADLGGRFTPLILDFHGQYRVYAAVPAPP